MIQGAGEEHEELDVNSQQWSGVINYQTETIVQVRLDQSWQSSEVQKKGKGCENSLVVAETNAALAANYWCDQTTPVLGDPIFACRDNYGEVVIGWEM